ncbi:hypothetical protein GCM10009037_19950 [Halarchaeum grantii]|uniref:Uncharacterized protein n=1 Tax=Halarchaeum grantii TaxID=1193105 RepID=A0A830EW16_9EURY|nr:antitoxin VapB family protein [Halarchaeum grantii]GGL36371.1 hypothetical protein GCM10009037_19950 [Halarchaeum grantii]
MRLNKVHIACVPIHKHKTLPSKNIGLREDVYDRLKAHKRGDESFSETLERLLDDVDGDWRTHIGFLSGADAEELEAEVERGLDELDDSMAGLGDRIDTAFADGEEDTSLTHIDTPYA